MDGSSCVLLISRGRQTVKLFFLTIIITKQFKLFTTLHFPTAEILWYNLRIISTVSVP